MEKHPPGDAQPLRSRLHFDPERSITDHIQRPVGLLDERQGRDRQQRVFLNAQPTSHDNPAWGMNLKPGEGNRLDAIVNHHRMDAVCLRRQIGDKATDRSHRLRLSPDGAKEGTEPPKQMVGLLGHTAGNIPQMRGQDIWDACQQPRRQRDRTCRDGKMCMDDVRMPATRLTQNGEKVRRNI
jgi:hypothetical protein